MLSVILYGRNDSHGYNLHKRAAISLNAIAHLLSGEDDEIIFVDYNTPDDLPTFPEAIADTLTAKAIEKLRVLRVRPAVHAERFGGRTHLNALEPIARNVAIRRSNPNNRWVLSTNTDMIFVPRKPGQDLTSAIGSLEDGFYHLPRFELPEGLWESLDRKDPEALIRSAEAWGQRFYLNEIILSGNDNLYDGPGDFQLFLREDLFAIGGFHEEMIRGWHLDANVARRMRLLRGTVSSALDRLIGYHCDHTRMASVYHKADRLENDPVRYVDEVQSPQAAEQMDGWGLPDVAVEELTLGRSSGRRYLDGLEKAVRGRLEGFLEAAYVVESHGRLGYELNHVLPYLLDLVACISPDSVIGYVGGRRDTFAAFAEAWREMGGVRPVQVPQDAAWLAGLDAPAAALPIDRWLEQADLFVFEIGADQARDQASLSAEESARLWQVDQAFKAAVRHDLGRQAGGAAPRRVLVVNAIHNFFEPQTQTSMSATLTPFSTRIRHGYIADRSLARSASASGPAKAAMSALGMLEPLTAANMAQIKRLIAELTEGRGDVAFREAGRLAAEIEALALIGAEPPFDALDSRLWANIAEQRPTRRCRPDRMAADAGRDAPNRLIRLEDWEDAPWAALARVMFANRDHGDIFGRESWTWERVSLARNLAHTLPPQTRARLLVGGRRPERLTFVLAHLGYEVDIFDPAALAEGRRRAIDWRADFAAEGWVSPRPVGLLQNREADLAGGMLYDAVVIPQNALFEAGRAGAAPLLREASALLRPGGRLELGLACQMFAAGAPAISGLPARLVADGAFTQAMAELAGFIPAGAADDRVTPRTWDRLRTHGGDRGGPQPLMTGLPPEVEAVGVFSFVKAEDHVPDWAALGRVLVQGFYENAGSPVRPAPEAPPAGQAAAPEHFSPAELADALAALAEGPDQPVDFGSIFTSLQIAPEVAASPAAISLRAGQGARVVATARLGQRGPDWYEISMDVSVLHAGAEVGLALAVLDSEGLAAEHAEVLPPRGSHRVTFEFQGRKRGRMSLVIKALGTADLDIVDVILR